jgi:hypothetical protein
MLWRFIGLVLSFAFRRTTNAIDGSQVVLASALPAVAKVIGVPFAPDTSADGLAYIGLAAVAFVGLRLISAPYFVWKEQSGEIGDLRLELEKPERIELDALARKRAQARLDLAKLTGKIRWELAVLAAVEDKAARDSRGEEIRKKLSKALAIAGLLPTSVTTVEALGCLNTACSITLSGKSTEATIQGVNDTCMLLVGFLHGNKSADEVMAGLPRELTIAQQA